MAEWSGDGEMYQGNVRVFKTSNGQRHAKVTYAGFDSDDDEWVPVSRLKKRKKKDARPHTPDVTIIDGTYLIHVRGD